MRKRPEVLVQGEEALLDARSQGRQHSLPALLASTPHPSKADQAAFLPAACKLALFLRDLYCQLFCWEEHCRSVRYHLVH